MDRMGGVLWVSEEAEHEWCAARQAADTDEDGFSNKTEQVKDDVTQKWNGVVLTSHFDSGKVSPGFSSPAGLADVGDWGSGGDMGIGSGIGCFWPSGVSGPRLDVGWIMITVLPVGLEHENKNPAVWERVKSTGLDVYSFTSNTAFRCFIIKRHEFSQDSLVLLA